MERSHSRRRHEDLNRREVFCDDWSGGHNAQTLFVDKVQQALCKLVSLSNENFNVKVHIPREDMFDKSLDSNVEGIDNLSNKTKSLFFISRGIY